MGEKHNDPEVSRTSDTNGSNSSLSESKRDGLQEETARAWVNETQEKGNINNKLRNPLSGFSREELLRDVEKFALEKGLTHILDELKKGALIAQDPRAFDSLEDLDENEKELLRREKTHRWHQPFMMYFMTSMSMFRNKLEG